MEAIDFWKMSGSGNDFILIDNRSGRIAEEDMSRLVLRACRRRESVGADGVIFLTPSDRYDFGWRFLNADGGEVEMCGNGARCVSRFAYLNGIAGPEMTFETLAGPIKARVRGRSVKVRLPDPRDLELDLPLEGRPRWQSIDRIHTGVPHAVIQVEDLAAHPVVEEGRFIRYHEAFGPEGTNADFMRVDGQNSLHIRTYERGVEDETLACGTGAVAAALVASARNRAVSPVRVTTKSGENLMIHFTKTGEIFKEVWLEGNTAVIYTGRLHEEAL